MQLDDTAERANALLAAYVLREYRDGNGDNEHLRQCPDAVATDVEGRNGSYGCDTGCEYVRLDAEVSCPHGEREEFEYGEFGDLAGIIASLEADGTP